MRCECGQFVTEQIFLRGQFNHNRLAIHLQETALYRQFHHIGIMDFLKQYIKQNDILLTTGWICHLVEELCMLFGDIGSRNSLNEFYFAKTIFLRVLLKIVFYFGARRTDDVDVYGESAGTVEMEHQ